MNVDCHWIEEKLEAFFCDTLTPDESRAAASHLTGCVDCRRKVEQLRAIDPMVQRVFQQNLAMARVPRRRRSSLTLGAFAAAAVSIVLLVVWAMPRQSALSTSQSMTSAQPQAAAAAELTSV